MKRDLTQARGGPCHPACHVTEHNDWVIGDGADSECCYGYFTIENYEMMMNRYENLVSRSFRKSGLREEKRATATSSFLFCIRLRCTVEVHQ